jgi:drug/metabolite transporter (DMT)-like permease
VRPRHVLMLVLLSAVWGASYLLIAEAAEGMPESLVVLGRTGLAALTLGILIAVRGGEARAALGVVRRRPGWAVVLGFVAIALPFMLITFGERTVPTGLSATLIAAAPIFIAILAPVLDRSQVMSPAQWTGLLIGLGGVALLVGVEQVGSTGELLGGLAMIGAAASYALSGFVLTRRYPGVPPVVTTFTSVAAAAALTVPVVVVQPPDHVPGLGPVLAVVALAVVGTAWAFVVYFRLIAEIGYGRASVVAYTIPPVALAYGWALRDERITAATVAGGVLILLGVWLTARGGARARRDAVPVAPEAAVPPR